MVKGWKIKKIGDLTTVVSGGTPSTLVPEFWGGRISWMSSGELNYKRIHKVLGRITEMGLSNSSTTMIPIECVLVGLAGQGRTRGTVAINYIPLCTNQSIAAIFPNKSFISEYLYQNLDRRYEELRELSTGDGGRGGLNLTIIKNLEIPYPTIKEQSEIAKVLSDADEYIATLEKLIEKKKAIKTGTMQELLTGKRRLKGFTGKWVEKQIGKLGDFYSGLTGKTAKDFGTGNAKYITFLNVLSNTAIDTSFLGSVLVSSSEKQNLVSKGDLFFNTSSETPTEVGMCAALLDDLTDTYLNSFCFGMRLTDSSIDALFLSYYFNSNIGRKIMTVLAQGATRYNLTKSYFSETIIIVPEHKEQTAIAEVLFDMDAEIEALSAKLQKVKAIKTGMMQQLLTGQIRLVEVSDDDTVEAATVAVKPTHNKEFEDAVIISAIVNGFYNPQFPLGRVKITKLRYLFDRKRGSDISGYKEKAAGPYDPSVRYSGGESIAKRNGYITISQTAKGATFVKGKKIGDIQGYIEKWGMRADIEWLCGFLRWGRDELEVLATVDNARVKLEGAGQEVTVKAIIDYILQSPEWQAKREREIFADDVIAAALQKSRELFG